VAKGVARCARACPKPSARVIISIYSLYFYTPETVTICDCLSHERLDISSHQLSLVSFWNSHFGAAALGAPPNPRCSVAPSCIFRWISLPALDAAAVTASKTTPSHTHTTHNNENRNTPPSSVHVFPLAHTHHPASSSLHFRRCTFLHHISVLFTPNLKPIFLNFFIQYQ